MRGFAATSAVAVLVGCAAAVAAQAVSARAAKLSTSNLGAPPSTRLVPFQSAMKGMCGHIVNGSHDVAKAIGAIYKQHHGKLAASFLVKGTLEFKRGSALLATGQKHLLLIGGKSVFTT
jgi:hypothetical protein